MGLLSTILGIFGLSKGSVGDTARHATFQEQLGVFEELGFELNNGIELSDVDRWGGTQAFEENGEVFSLLYITLGQTIERDPWIPLTNRCWHFDTEAIEGDGSYVEIIKNLSRITRGELVFEDIKDHVPFDGENAWVSFRLNGESYEWDFKIDNDWVDPELFSNIAELTKTIGTKGRYTYFDTGGQDLVVGYETPEDLEKLREKTGLKIVWLE